MTTTHIYNPELDTLVEVDLTDLPDWAPSLDYLRGYAVAAGDVEMVRTIDAVRGVQAPSRRLILDDGDHTDLGPATPEQIEAMEAAEARGEYAIAVDPETLKPLWPGDFGYGDAITVWVD